MGRISGFILMLLFLSACHVGKKDPRVRHEGPARANGGLGDRSSNTPVGTISGTSQTSGTPRATGGGDDDTGQKLERLYSLAQKPGNEDAPEIFNSLASILLDPTHLSDPQFRAHPRARWALSHFNSQLIRAVKARGLTPELKKTLALYRDRILRGCAPGKLTGCLNLDFFDRGSQTGSVLKLLARESPTVTEQFTLLFAAYEVLNRRADPELHTMVQERALDLLKVYVHSQSSSEGVRLQLRTLTSEQKQDFAAFTRFLANVLQTGDRRALKIDTRTVELFRWLASNQLSNVAGPNLAAVLSNMISDQLTHPLLWKEFVRHFSLEQKSQDLSYTNALKRIRKTNPSLLKRFHVKPIDIENLISTKSRDLAAILFYARIFDLRPQAQQKNLWQIAQINDLKALEYLESMLKVTFLDRILFTNGEMANFFLREYQHDGSNSSELLEDAQRFADQNLTPVWKDYLSRVNLLEKFFAEELEIRAKAQNNNTALVSGARQLRRLFTVFNPSIKYLVTYPNMIMLGYYASKLRLKTESETIFQSTLEINKDLILHNLMEGHLMPMFIFTSYPPDAAAQTTAPIDSVQMLWSLYFAIVTDLPRLYGISAKDFLNVFFKGYKERSDQRMLNLIRHQEQISSPNSDVRKLLWICRAGENSFDNQMDLKTFVHSTFLGELSQRFARPPLKSVVEEVDRDAREMLKALDEVLEVLRTDVDPKINRLYLIRDLFNGNGREHKEALQEIDDQMKETLQLRAQLLATTRMWVEEVPECLLKLRNVERQRRYELVRMEKIFLQYVDTALRALKESPTPSEGLSRLKAQGGFFTDLDVTQSPEVTLNELFLRRSGMVNAFPYIRGYENGYRISAGFQKDSLGRYYFNYRRIDLLVRLSQFLSQGFEGRRITPGPDRVRVTFPPDLRDFEFPDPKELTNDYYLYGKDSIGAKDHFLYSMPGDGVLRSGLEHFRNCVEWFKDIVEATSVFRSLLRQATALYKYDYLAGLSADVARQKMIGLLELSAKILNSLTIHPETEEILSLFQTDSFYNFKRSTTLTVHFGPTELFTSDHVYENHYFELGDEVFTYLTSVSLGHQPVFWGIRKGAEAALAGATDSDIRPEERVSRRGEKITAEEMMMRTQPYEQARLYYRSIRDKDWLQVFPIEPSIDAAIIDFHVKRIRSDFEMEKLLETVAVEWGSRAQIPLMRFSLIKPPYRTIILNPSLTGAYHGKIREFHTQTSDVFKLKENR